MYICVLDDLGSLRQLARTCQCTISHSLHLQVDLMHHDQWGLPTETMAHVALMYFLNTCSILDWAHVCFQTETYIPMFTSQYEDQLTAAAAVALDNQI